MKKLFYVRDEKVVFYKQLSRTRTRCLRREFQTYPYVCFYFYECDEKSPIPSFTVLVR